MIEMFEGRIEATKPGVPLSGIPLVGSTSTITERGAGRFHASDRFCEESGSGVDKIVAETEVY